MKDLIIVGNVADNPFVVDVAHHIQLQPDYSDLISLKDFTNTEFCPRFILDEEDNENIGRKLANRQVLIVSTSIGFNTRNDLAMRSFLIARGARDNGADRVALLEPDLFYSAQDRGPRIEHGVTEFKRTREDFQKFDGQPFSARLYADLLKEAGVDEVITVHNHSRSVTNIFMDRLSGNFCNLEPVEVYADYMMASDVVKSDNLVLCAPDKGACGFVKKVHKELGNSETPLLIMDKVRKGERDVHMCVSESSPAPLEAAEGRDVVVLDDMVRTGNTMVECCELIRSANPRKIVIFITHFFSSREIRAKLNSPSVDEIVTTNTIPHILNRDIQGRLRSKLVVLKIERWVAQRILERMHDEPPDRSKPFYAVDMSSKNPRWRGQMGPLFSSV